MVVLFKFTHFGIWLPLGGSHIPKWWEKVSWLGGGGFEAGVAFDRQRRRDNRLVLISSRDLHISTVISACTKGEQNGNQHEGEQSVCHRSQLYGG